MLISLSYVGSTPFVNAAFLQFVFMVLTSFEEQTLVLSWRSSTRQESCLSPPLIEFTNYSWLSFLKSTIFVLKEVSVMSLKCISRTCSKRRSSSQG